jgi:hypothetical protein
MTCEELRKRIRAVSAFAIISVLLAGGMLIVGLAARIGSRWPACPLTGLPLAIVLSVLTFVTSLVTWAMGARLYYQKGICGSDSLSTEKFEMGAGLALFVTGWALSAIAVLIAVKDPKVPAVVPDAVLDKVAAIVYTILAFAAFVFVVIGTPLQIVHLWASSTYMLRATMWHVYIYNFAAATTTKVTFSEFGTLFDCTYELPRYATFAQAFAIIAIAFMFFAFISGLLASGGKIGKAGPIVLGLLGTLTALLSAAACATIFYRKWCNALPSLHELGFRLAAGVALFVAAVLCLAVATIILLIVALVQHVASGAAGGNVKPTAFLFLFGSVLSLFFLILGASLPLFTKNTNANYVKVNWWHAYQKTGPSISIVDFGCKDMSQRLVGGGALVIISIFFTVVSLLLGVVQLVSASVRKAVSFVGLVSSLTQLVAWGLAASVYMGTFCGVEMSVTGFDISVGLGLTVASWCLTTVICVLNLLVSP